MGESQSKVHPTVRDYCIPSPISRSNELGDTTAVVVLSLACVACQSDQSADPFPISSQPTSTSPTIEIREPNADYKMIADIACLSVTVARKCPKESAAFGFGFCLAELVDAARNS